MFLFRWRAGARNEAQANVDSNLAPPSYEDSQDASLREVLQGARAVLPLLWPSASDSLSTPSTTSYAPSSSESTNEYQSIAPDTKLRTEKSGQDTESTRGNPAHEENAIIEVLANLAIVSCDGRPFLDRIRQFSDFYFTPYTSEDECTRDEPVPLPERQRIILQNINAPRESAALVLCARVLEEYYAKLRRVDTTREFPVSTSQGVCSGHQKEKPRSSSNATEESSGESPSSPGLKTRLTQIAPCSTSECTCSDFDEAIPTQTPDDSKPPLCSCGHPRTSHSESAGAEGLSRLLRHYTNWDSGTYAALRHRAITGRRKGQVAEIHACSAKDCACRDYDKWSYTALCARCGHHNVFHLSLRETQKLEEEKEGKRRGKRKGRRGGDNASGAGGKIADWELSWILVENAYSLLTRIVPVSLDEKQ
ncbi:hypothetical protein F5B22DRAFT_539222 [Xylaria bambusicola]|uniref:uncharacterized protein n=1 Tax=Xylaria bambusicola TaxID=326684 RepID=UPI0020078224|nr:uncharacterized protein F5B22DRAFT_539222 [Xylaria bambusicola]KAI0521469.1 hypothetical protein F5B22DRAFT_539222 [Xylaria bambusicola]